MSKLVMVWPVLFRIFAPHEGITVPDRRPPNARSELLVAPKLYEFPPLSLPVPAAYVESALPPLSLIAHPCGSVEEVPLFASVSKFSVALVPVAVRET